MRQFPTKIQPLQAVSVMPATNIYDLPIPEEMKNPHPYQVFGIEDGEQDLAVIGEDPRSRWESQASQRFHRPQAMDQSGQTGSTGPLDPCQSQGKSSLMPGSGSLPRTP